MIKFARFHDRKTSDPRRFWENSTETSSEAWPEMMCDCRLKLVVTIGKESAGDKSLQ